MRVRVVGLGFASRDGPRGLRPGVKRVELAVMVAIICISLTLFVLLIEKARETARSTACLSKMRHLAIACQNHQDGHKTMPPGYGVVGNWPKDRAALGSCFYHPLPY